MIRGSLSNMHFNFLGFPGFSCRKNSRKTCFACFYDFLCHKTHSRVKYEFTPVIYYNLALICDQSQLSSFIRLEMARENAWEGQISPMKKVIFGEKSR